MAWFEYNMTREDVLEEHPNATEEQIQATIDYWNDPKRYAAGIARSAGQGITFGYGDELTAFIKSRFGKNSYEELVEHEREELEKFRKENPELADLKTVKRDTPNIGRLYEIEQKLLKITFLNLY